MVYAISSASSVHDPGPVTKGLLTDLGWIYAAVVTPTVTTTTVSSVTETNAVSGGNVTSDGGASVTDRGVCVSTSANPTLANAHTHDGSGTGAFTSSLTGCTPGTPYHVRAYATNSVGTAYGSDLTFTTLSLGGVPTVTTTAISSLTKTSFMTGGNVTSAGSAAVTDRGVCVSTAANPTLANNHTHDGAGTGVFISSLTGGTPGETYHVRAYATSTAGTAYGNDIWFQTLGGSKNDFNGDGYEDILWRNTATGENYLWYLGPSGADLAGSLTIDSRKMFQDAAPAKVLEVTGDLFKGEPPSICWDPRAGEIPKKAASISTGRFGEMGPKTTVEIYRTPSEGIATILGLTKIGGDYLLAVTDLTWQIVGTGDFNGDGKPDIIWRNSVMGENYIWYMNGVTKIGGDYLLTVMDMTWQIVGTGDFNGDGKPDIIWRNSVMGENYIWYMDGVTKIGGDYLLTVTDLTWQIVGTGNFDGDGKPDIIWRNSVTGENYIWYMNGVTKVGGDYLLTVTDLTWQIVGTGDFDGDGKPDIIWRNSVTGENYIWYMDGVTRIGGDYLLTVTDLNWKIVNR
jgi:hypothetical protein